MQAGFRPLRPRQANVRISLPTRPEGICMDPAQAYASPYTSFGTSFLPAMDPQKACDTVVYYDGGVKFFCELTGIDPHLLAARMS